MLCAILNPSLESPMLPPTLFARAQRLILLAPLFASILAPAWVSAHPSTAIPSERLEGVPEKDIKKCPKPHWPDNALRGEHGGNVVLAFLVAPDGKVIDTVVRQSSRNAQLDAAAQIGIMHCQFAPRLIKGVPASTWLGVTYVFNLLQNGAADAQQSIERLHRNAKTGDPEAIYKLAQSYLQDFDESERAQTLIREAADRGHPPAIHDVADIMWHGGPGVPQNQPKALTYYMAAAERGHAASQYEIGMVYAYGIGVTPNEVKAMEWFGKAAKQGHASAQYELAEGLSMGLGGAQDAPAAASWYRQAAQKGDLLAQTKLAQLYRDGKGVEKSASQAAAWLRKAADLRHPRAEAMLAELYLAGVGVGADNAEALKLLQRSATGGDLAAMVRLGDLLAKGERTAADATAAANWHRRAAALGDATAMRRLAATAATPELAKEWLQKAQQGDLPSK
jgi:TonB family protein